jgi:hypothetical protein
VVDTASVVERRHLGGGQHLPVAVPRGVHSGHWRAPAPKPRRARDSGESTDVAGPEESVVSAVIVCVSAFVGRWDGSGLQMHL